jgi:hypothetical protein
MTTALFNIDGNIAIRSVNDAARIDHIPAAVYKIAITEAGLNLIKDRAKYDLPEKVFGKSEMYRDLVVKDFTERKTQSTGVILEGLKGSGKTLLAEMLANKVLERDIPVFIVDSPLSGELLTAIARLCAPCMFLFDEFGKVYTATEDKNRREGLLTFFSDSSLGNVLNVVTANTVSEIDTNMIDRPGRFKYRLAYGGLTDADIHTILDDYELPSDIRAYLEIYCAINTLSYDMVITMARYAMNCPTKRDLYDMFHVLNVPSPWTWAMVPLSVHINNELFVGDQVWEQNGSQGTIKLFAPDGEHVRDIHFDIEKDRRVDQGKVGTASGESACKTSIYLRGEHIPYNRPAALPEGFTASDAAPVVETPTEDQIRLSLRIRYVTTVDGEKRGSIKLSVDGDGDLVTPKKA